MAGEPFSSRLEEGFQRIREKNFSEALIIADEWIRKESREPIAWYLGLMALTGLRQFNSMDHYFSQLEYLPGLAEEKKFASAYLAILAEDTERAIIEWTKVLEGQHGGKAKEILESLRKQYPVHDTAREGDVEFFFPYPNLQYKSAEAVPVSESSQKKKKPAAKFYLALLGITLLAGLFILSYASMKRLIQDIVTDTETKQIRIPDSVSLQKSSDTSKLLFQYESIQKIREEFQKARQELHAGKINQARVRLNRIRHSNADFVTREKAGYYLNFIPTPPAENFDDNLTPEIIFRNPALYANCLVLWKIHDVRLVKKEDGIIFSGTIQAEKTTTPVAAFLKKAQYETFRPPDKKLYPSLKVYGIFKGIPDQKKTIYLELIRVWP